MGSSTHSVNAETALLALAFDEWLAMEDPAMVHYENRYNAVAPVFAKTLLPEGDQVGRLNPVQEQAAEDFVDRAHAAAILSLPGVAVAPPGLSASYVAWRGMPCDPRDDNGNFGPTTHESALAANNEGVRIGTVTVWLQQPPPEGGEPEQWVVERRFGPAQRESLLSRYSTPPDPIDANAAEVLAWNLRRLETADWGDRRHVALQFIDAMTLLLTDGTPLDDALVFLVSALENLLNPDADPPLGKVFGARCAAWFAENPEQRASDLAAFRAAYNVRSSTLHGTDSRASMRKFMTAINGAGDDDLRGWIRLFCMLSIDWLAAWFGHAHDDDASGSAFRGEVTDAASMDDDAWAAARARLLEGRWYVRD
jgi:hypothetical protein